MDDKIKEIYMEYFEESEWIEDADEIDAVRKYAEKHDGKLPEGYYENDFGIYTSLQDKSLKELETMLMVSQAQDIRTMKKIIKFMFVLFIISSIIAVICGIIAVNM